jgi:hypothetical protein
MMMIPANAERLSSTALRMQHSSNAYEHPSQSGRQPVQQIIQPG